MADKIIMSFEEFLRERNAISTPLPTFANFNADTMYSQPEPTEGDNGIEVSDVETPTTDSMEMPSETPSEEPMGDDTEGGSMDSGMSDFESEDTGDYGSPDMGGEDEVFDFGAEESPETPQESPESQEPDVKDVDKEQGTPSEDEDESEVDVEDLDKEDESDGQDEDEDEESDEELKNAEEEGGKASEVELPKEEEKEEKAEEPKEESEDE